VLEFVEFGAEGEVELANRERELAGIPPDRFASDLAVADPHLYVALVGADTLQWSGLMDAAEHETHRGIANPAVLDFLQLANLIEGQVREVSLGIQA